MLTEQLLNREELLDELDTEPIFDYLLQHRVLDKSTARRISGEQTSHDRNTALLQHLEAHGTNAVALFINALRQSGQLRLASTLDVTQRIRPISGSGYWEKQRHKGQVLVNIQVTAIKVLAPLETPLKSNGHLLKEIYDVKMTPRRLHKSYDNMLMIDGEDTRSTKPIRIVDYPYICEDNSDEEVIQQKRSCWCMCFPMFRSRQKNKEKYIEKPKTKSSSKKVKSPSQKASARELKENPKFTTRYNSPKLNNSVISNCGDGSTNGYSRSNSPLKGNRNEHKNGVRGQKRHLQQSDRKENMDPISMRYNEQLELVEMKRYAHRDRLRENGRTTSQMCEKWKSEGKDYEDKACEFYTVFDNDLKNNCTKYFEQNRGTLILQIFCDAKGISVFNICMTKDQVHRLRSDYECGALEQQLQELLVVNGTTEHLNVLGIKLSVNIETDQFPSALQELT